MLAVHGVPFADFLASLQVAHDVIGDHLPADAADLARQHIDGAVAEWDTA